MPAADGAGVVKSGAYRAMEHAALRRLHWRRNLLLIGLLLPLWALASFVLPWHARDYSFNFFGWPFSFWAAAQGTLLCYLGIVWLYARTMDRIDAACGVLEPDEG